MCDYHGSVGMTAMGIYSGGKKLTQLWIQQEKIGIYSHKAE